MAGLSQTHVHLLLSRKRSGTDDVWVRLAEAGRVYPPGDLRNEWDSEAWWLKRTETRNSPKRTSKRRSGSSHPAFDSKITISLDRDEKRDGKSSG